jgi:phosphoribosylformylglycinamidine cyclo-ligase
MTQPGHYARAGVDIDAKMRAISLMTAAIKATYTPEVLSDTTNFGGLYNASRLKDMAKPVLVASTDGVGTKTKVASTLGRWDTIGQDIVNHCVNDILVQGARPLFFLDYVASSRLESEQIATIVGGAAKACQEAGCALIAGETAEMPGVYEPGELDLVGTIVGVVDGEHLLDGRRIRAGDVILGLPSTGLHTNGYSLARTLLKDLDWTRLHPDLGCTPGDALLAVHRSYLKPVQQLWDAQVDIRGLAHITGGGFVDNVPRILPPGVDAVIRRGSWPELPIFGLLRRLGAVDDSEMVRVFNMGLGMLAVIPADQAALAQQTLPGDAYLAGEIVAGQRQVIIR